MSEWVALREELRAEALARGWCALGVTGTEPFELAGRRGLEAVAAGRMDGMPWMTAERVRASTDLGSRYPWARSIVALAWPYQPVEPAAPGPGPPRGRVAAYACMPDPGDEDGAPGDYHDLLGRRCDELVAWLRGRAGEVRAKRFVDHGWAMDRAVAERAGIGFTGKHASLLTTAAGSYVLLAELALSLPLPADPPSKKGCGSCTACLPACPTGAIVAPGVIDARRCISYLTIEHRGAIPLPLRPLMGTWVFGCDLCQEACPINHRRAPAPLAGGDGRQRSGPVPAPDLVDLLGMDEATFARRFAGSAIARTGRAGLARNAAIALGNAGRRSTAPALRHAMNTDTDPVVREAAAWALQRLGGRPDRWRGHAEPRGVSGSARSVEEPDGGAGSGDDRGADAEGHERDGIVLRRPPGPRQGAPDRHARTVDARRLGAEDGRGHPGQGHQEGALGGERGDVGGA